jgi:hypothetical protein
LILVVTPWQLRTRELRIVTLEEQVRDAWAVVNGGQKQACEEVAVALIMME